MGESKIDRRVLVLSGVGCVVAILAGLSEHVEWLSSLCTRLFGGCRQTAGFAPFGLPLWLWGVGFYLLLAISACRFQALVTWLVAAAFGVELRLLWVMFSTKAICVFCLGNFVVLVALFVMCFEKTRFWQTLSTSSLLLLLSIFLIPEPYKPLATPPGDQDRVVARVGGEVITSEDLERPMASQIFQLRRKIYDLKREQLEQMITQILLQQDAEKRGISKEQLVKKLLSPEVVHVSNEELERYYMENRANVADWQGSEDELKRYMKASLQRNKAYERIMDYARSIRKEYDVIVNLKHPAFPHAQVSVENDPAAGPSDAPVIIIEFSDYLCSACRKNREVINRIREIYEGQIRWIFKDLPLKGGAASRKAAAAAHCAAEQGKFWEYQDILYASDKKVTSEALKRHAKKLGLDMQRFNRCLENERHQVAIAEDLKEARRVGIDITPSYVVNGKILPGAPPFKRFKEIIEEELSRIKRY